MGNRTSIGETDWKKKANFKETQTKMPEEDIIIKCGLEDMVKQFFEDYMIVWHDPNLESEENKQYIAQLQKFCEVKTFIEWEKAAFCIQETKVHCHVITSGTNGELLVKEICPIQKVSGVYLFCRNKEFHEAWAKNYEKVSCVETQIQNVVDKIKENLLKWYKGGSSMKLNLPAFAPIFDDWDKSGMNNLHRYLKVIPNFKNRSQAKKDFLELSKIIYSDQKDMKFLVLFEKSYKEYSMKETLNWYTQESFVYRIVNKCLRIATSDSIQYCRLLLRDIEKAIKEQYQRKSKDFSGLLFRGAYLSAEEWSNLKANTNGEIEMHGFLSVSKDQNVALNFLRDPSKMVFITILVPKGPISGTDQGFAEVEEFSKFPLEKEILFNVRSRFTIAETEDEYSPEIPCRHLVLLYGAQEFRKFVAEKNPVHEMLIGNNENTSCFVCQKEISKKMLFKLITDEKDQLYFCRACSLSFSKANHCTLLCVPEGQLTEKTQIPGILMNYPAGLNIPMYGYQCCECKAKKREIYYRCTSCWSETRKVWCEDCVENKSSCLQKGHSMLLESIPFSFWSDKMSQKDLDHLKFQNEIVRSPDPFQQARMYTQNYQYQKAIDYYKIYIEKSKDDEKDISLANAYSNLADIYKDQAKYEMALENYSKSLKVLNSLDGNNSIHVVTCYISLGEVFEYQGKFQNALERCSEALEIMKSFDNLDYPEVASCLNRMGSVYVKQAEYQKALEHYSQALEIRKSIYGGNHPKIATCLNNIGDVYEWKAEHQKAFDYYSQALEIRKSCHGDNHPEVATCLNKMGSVYEKQKRYQKAFEYNSQALKIRQAFYGENHPKVATCLNRMGSVYERKGEYQKALEHYSQAFEIRKSVYGNNHPDVATCLNKMGSVYEKKVEYQKALEKYSQVLEIRKLFFGDDHRDIIVVSDKIKAIHRLMDNKTLAQ